MLSGRKDVIVVSSISCIYGIGNPDDFHSNTIHIWQGLTIARNQFLRKLVDSLYSRNELEFKHGTFRVRGDTVDIFPAYADIAIRVVFFGDLIEEISSFDPIGGTRLELLKEYIIYPANIFVTTRERINQFLDSLRVFPLLNQALAFDQGARARRSATGQQRQQANAPTHVA